MFPSFISGVHHSSSSSVFPRYISAVHQSSSSSAFPAISLRFTFLLLLLHSPAISLRFTILLLLLLLHSQPYLWGSPFFFFSFFCIPSYISEVHHSSSSSAFPAIFLGFTFLLLLLHSQLCLWGSPFFFFISPAIISGVHLRLLRSSALSLGFTFFFFCVPQLYLWGSPSSAFPAISLGFTILLLLLRSKLYLWGSPSSSAFPATSLGFTFFFCIPSYISGIHISSSFPNYYLWGSPSSSAFSSYISGVHLLLLPSPAISLWLNFLLLHSQLYLWCSPFFFFFCVPQLYLGFTIFG